MRMKNNPYIFMRNISHFDHTPFLFSSVHTGLFRPSACSVCPKRHTKKPCVRQKSNAGLYQIAQEVTLGLPPQALSGDQSPDPIFASRRFKSSLLNDAHARRKFSLSILARSGKRVQGTRFPAGVWGLESRARCAGFSVMEIGNRKKRFAFLYEFPGSKPQAFPLF